MYLEGKVTLDSVSTKKLSLKSNEAVAWMKNYFDRLVNICTTRLVQAKSGYGFYASLYYLQTMLLTQLYEPGLFEYVHIAELYS